MWKIFLKVRQKFKSLKESLREVAYKLFYLWFSSYFSFEHNSHSCTFLKNDCYLSTTWSTQLHSRGMNVLILENSITFFLLCYYFFFQSIARPCNWRPREGLYTSYIEQVCSCMCSLPRLWNKVKKFIVRNRCVPDQSISQIKIMLL